MSLKGINYCIVIRTHVSGWPQRTNEIISHELIGYNRFSVIFDLLKKILKT